MQEMPEADNFFRLCIIRIEKPLPRTTPLSETKPSLSTSISGFTSRSAINLLIVATLRPSFTRWSTDGDYFLLIHVALRESLRGL
jgi:hypothetical protein